MPAKNWEDFVYCITKAKDNWKLHYFTNRHYWIFALVIVSALLCGVFNFIKKKKENVVEENNVGLSLWWICAILFFALHFWYMVRKKKYEKKVVDENTIKGSEKTNTIPLIIVGILAILVTVLG